MKEVLLAMVMLFSTTGWAQTGEKNFIDQPYMEVTGKAEIEVAPDEIYLQILLREADIKNRGSVDDQEKRMIQALEQLGIDTQKNLKIKDVISNFKYKVFSQKEILLSKQYELMVHDGRTVGQVLLTLENIGVSNVSVTRVDHSNIEKFRHDVKVNAIRVAKEKAQDMAQAIGQTVGKALYVQEVDIERFAPQYSNVAVRAMGATSLDMELKDKVAPLDFETIKLQYSILCRFELK
jgi:Uncharacterized conserved protein